MINNSNLLDGITVFVRVVETQSFTEAARLLGHSQSFISKEITRLEARLRIRLFNRTTRSLNLTDEGRAYFERCRQIVIDAEDAESALGQLQESPRGILKISVPVTFGITHLCDALPHFLIKYPSIDLEVDYNERSIDVVAEGFDVAIQIGQIKDSNLISKKIMSSIGVYVASPDYLKARGTPTNPADLYQHDCINFTLSNVTKPWEFQESNGDVSVINVKTRVRCNSAELEASMAIAGIGITRMPIISCQRALEEGKLVRILKPYESTDLGIYALYPHRQFLPAKTKVFLEFLCQDLPK